MLHGEYQVRNEGHYMVKYNRKDMFTSVLIHAQSSLHPRSKGVKQEVA